DRLTIDPPLYLIGKMYACWRCGAKMPVVAILAPQVGVPGVIAGKFPVSSNWFVISVLQDEFCGGQRLTVAAVMRVAKNPMQRARIRPLIFQELESRSCRGHKVMILATSATVKKLPITPATPARGPLQQPGGSPPGRSRRQGRPSLPHVRGRPG